MVIFSEDIKKILYAQQNYNGLFDYFSFQERIRLADVFVSALANVPDENDYNKWEITAKNAIDKEFEDAKEYFSRQDIIYRLDLSSQLKQIYDVSKNNLSLPQADLGESLLNYGFDLNTATP